MKTGNSYLLSTISSIFICTGALCAAEPAAPIKELILPGEAFLVADRPAFIFLPPEMKRSEPQPWIMYAPTLPGFPDSHEKWMHERFLEAGVAVAGIDAGEAYGSPHGQELCTALYRELTENRGFAKQPCLLGRSRGGLWVSSWAIANPDKVAGIAAIYPVFDLRTYPGIEKAAPSYALTADEFAADLDKHNPIQRTSALAEAKIPVFLIHGKIDEVVPLKENSAALQDQYQAAGAGDAIELIVVDDQGHNYWEGFFRCRELIDFAIERAKAGARTP
jgi:dipeptidyl aminopeptidase/acylaminoacyl peptidase